MDSTPNPMVTHGIALQLYTVRQALLEDFSGTLRRVRDIGYRAVETYPFPPQISVAMAGDVLKSLELEVIAMHCDLPLGGTKVLDMAAAFNCRRIIWHGWPRSSEHDSLKGIHRLVTVYNESCATARRNGLEFGLHNHWWEFETVDNTYPYRIFHELLHPDVFMEIDTYWVQTAGLNPSSVLQELRTRVRLLHLKDGPAVHGKPMTAVGEGVLNFDDILRSVRGAVGLIVELDECATDIFEAVDRSYRYVQRLMNPSNGLV